ncbi:hypothetical protein BC829DRAFT_449805 [Chytridium lagenaria]|nr:hypothetical protein BC829DRAFT_449805 [Chytridium lagenaria]
MAGAALNAAPAGIAAAAATSAADRITPQQQQHSLSPSPPPTSAPTSPALKTPSPSSSASSSPTPSMASSKRKSWGLHHIYNRNAVERDVGGEHSGRRSFDALGTLSDSSTGSVIASDNTATVVPNTITNSSSSSASTTASSNGNGKFSFSSLSRSKSSNLKRIFHLSPHTATSASSRASFSSQRAPAVPTTMSNNNIASGDADTLNAASPLVIPPSVSAPVSPSPSRSATSRSSGLYRSKTVSTPEGSPVPASPSPSTPSTPSIVTAPSPTKTSTPTIEISSAFDDEASTDLKPLPGSRRMSATPSSTPVLRQVPPAAESKDVPSKPRSSTIGRRPTSQSNGTLDVSGVTKPRSITLSRRAQHLGIPSTETEGEDDVGFYSDGGLYAASAAVRKEEGVVSDVDVGGSPHRSLATKSSKHKLKPNNDLLHPLKPRGSRSPSVHRDGDDDDGDSARISTDISFMDVVYSSDGGGLTRSATSASSIRSGAATTKGLQRAMHKIFVPYGMPSTERLIHIFMCATPRSKILQQGHMFVTDNYVCFHSNIFGFQTSYLLHSSDILAVDPARTAMVIPNAIMVTTRDGDEYFFTSFVQREKALSVMLALIGHSSATTLKEETSSGQEGIGSNRGRSGRRSRRHDLGKTYGSDYEGGSPSFLPSSTTNPSTSSELSEDDKRNQPFLLSPTPRHHRSHHSRQHQSTSRSPSTVDRMGLPEGLVRSGSGVGSKPSIPGHLRVHRRSSTNAGNGSPPGSPILNSTNILLSPTSFSPDSAFPLQPLATAADFPFPFNYILYPLEVVGNFVLTAATPTPTPAPPPLAGRTRRGSSTNTPPMSPIQLHPIPRRVSPSPGAVYTQALLNTSVSSTSLKRDAKRHSYHDGRTTTSSRVLVQKQAEVTWGAAFVVIAMMGVCILLAVGNSVVLWRVRGIVRVLEEVAVGVVVGGREGVVL